MKRNLKVFGLALLVVFAIGPIAAEVALAEGEEFYSEAEHVVGTGEGANHVMTLGSLSFECANAKFEGTALGTEVGGGDFIKDEMTVAFDYFGSGEEGKCDSGGGETNTDVEENGCHFLIDSDTTEGNPTEGEHANFQLLCPEEKVVIVSTVTVTIPSQSIEHGMHYKNEGSGSKRDITVEATAHGIEWSCSSAAFACTIALGGTSGSDGTYTGNTTAQAFEYLEGETGSYAHGEQVGVWWN